MPRKKIHVVPYGGDWAVKREGNSKASKVFDTKEEAINEARNMAWRNSEEVIVHNKQGHITKGKRYGKNPDDDNCFITTACVKHFNLPDNCYQLQILRFFRDNYLQHSEGGNELIKKYYSIAPQIVKLLNEHTNKNKLFKNIFSQINFACALVEQKKNEEAKKFYVKIVSQLINFFHLS